MKILIISFDKKLSEELKEVFSKEEVITVKNSEEALKIAPTHVDVVIYDAISGAISEEDINNIYQKKFSESRYVVLYDELFPVNGDNLLPEKKVLIPREESPKKIKDIALSSDFEYQRDSEQQETAAQEVVEEETQQEETQLEETEVPQLDESLLELSAIPEGAEEGTATAETPQEQVESPEEAIVSEAEETPQVETSPVEEESVADTQEPAEETQEETVLEPSSGRRKILLVSFDATLIDSIKSKFGSEYEIVVVKNTRQATDKGVDSDLIIYDAISGVIAEKGLMELSENPQFSVKPYLILVDDLFPIDVDKIPLNLKKSLSRDTGLEEIKSSVEELISQASSVKVEESPKITTAEEPTEKQEEPAVEEVSAESPETEEEIPALENLDKIVEELEKGMEETPQIETEPAPEEELPLEELEAMAQEMPPLELDEEEKPAPAEEISHTEQSLSPPQELTAESLGNIEEIIRSAVAEKLSSVDIEGVISKLVRESVQEALSKIDFVQIIREETSKILREKIDELLK